MEDVTMAEAVTTDESAATIEPKAFHRLMDLPLEIRQRIYACAAEREYGPEYVLKAWLDKVCGYMDRGCYTNVDGIVEEDYDSDDSDQDDDGDEDEQQDGEDESDEGDEQEDADELENDEAAHGDGAAQGDEDAQEGDAAEDEDYSALEHTASDEDSEDEDNQIDLSTGVIINLPPTTINPIPRPPPTAETRRTPNRHTVGMFGISACPPPMALLQSIKNEAKDAFFNTATFHINVNKGVRHLTFFEETIKHFRDAPFSPLEQMRKMRITICWNSQWLKDHETITDDQGVSLPGLNRDICDTFLMHRVELTAKLIALAMPELRQLLVCRSRMSPRSFTTCVTNYLIDPVVQCRQFGQRQP